MKHFVNRGKTIQLNWTLHSISGQEFALTGHTYKLFFATGNQSAQATGVTHSGNVLSWTFTPDAQWKLGSYTIWLEVYNNGTKIVTVAYPDAFHLAHEVASGGTTQTGTQTESTTLNLVSSLDFYRFAPVIPVAGDDGYWYVNGVKAVDGNGEYILTSHTLEYDETTRNLIIDKDRVDSEGNSIEQIITALADLDSSYQAAEGSEAGSEAGDGSRWGAYKTAETARGTAYSNAEGTSSSTAGDGSRWGAYKTAEAARNTARQTAEGSSSSEAGDGSRWGEYKSAEAKRNSAFETSTGNLIEETTAAAEAASGAASDANTAASRANTAAAAAEHMIEIHEGPAGKSAYQQWLDAGNTGSEADFLASLNGKSAYQIWLDEGNTGDEAAFLASLDGKSAYQIWLDAGHTGSEADFLEYLEGQPGADGVGFASVSSPQDGTIVITLSNGDTITLDLNHNHDSYYSKVVGTAQPSGGFLPDVAYNLGEISGTVTFTLAAAVTGNVNHYFWMFDTSSTAPTITWPTGITWASGSAPTVATSKHYEISVLGGIAYYSEV